MLSSVRLAAHTRQAVSCITMHLSVLCYDITATLHMNTLCSLHYCVASVIHRMFVARVCVDPCVT